MKKIRGTTALDLTNIVFGRLTVVKKGDSIKTPCGSVVAVWLCKCSCGNEKEVRAGDLRSGRVRSCGCFNNEVRIARSTTHGMKGLNIYYVWQNMKSRCDNIEDVNYHNYGGRGITYCDKWADFEGFYEDMGEAPNSLSLDRIDNDGGYNKENCRWATREQQTLNKQNSKKIMFEGKLMHIKKVAEKVGLKHSTLYERLYVYNWPLDKAITQKINRSTM